MTPLCVMGVMIPYNVIQLPSLRNGLGLGLHQSKDPGPELIGDCTTGIEYLRSVSRIPSSLLSCDYLCWHATMPHFVKGVYMPPLGVHVAALTLPDGLPSYVCAVRMRSWWCLRPEADILHSGTSIVTSSLWGGSSPLKASFWTSQTSAAALIPSLKPFLRWLSCNSSID